MTALYAPVIPERRPKKIPRKCSTCADRSCRARGSVCDWLDCWKWTPGNNKTEVMQMKRLTTDFPHGNFQTLFNFVYGKDGWAHIRHDGKSKDVPLTAWAKAQCLRWRGEFPDVSAEEVDQILCGCMMDFPDCPIALAYCFASQAVHLRDRLMVYEDVLFGPDGTELITLAQLQGLRVMLAGQSGEETGR